MELCWPAASCGHPWKSGPGPGKVSPTRKIIFFGLNVNISQDLTYLTTKTKVLFNFITNYAEVAELVDALDSKSSAQKA